MFVLECGKCRKFNGNKVQLIFTGCSLSSLLDKTKDFDLHTFSNDFLVHEVNGEGLV